MTKTVTLYDGQVIIKFDPGPHRYDQTGPVEPQLPIPGVTSMLSKIIPKDMLLPWAANMAVDHIRHRWHGKMDGPEFEQLCLEARKAHVVARDSAGDIGTAAHKFFEDILKTGRATLPADPTAAKACAAFLDWFHQTKIEVIASERICFSRHHWYCCTTDLYARIEDELCVADFKTSSGVFYDEGPILQLAANAIAIEEELADPINVGWLLHLDKKNGKFLAYRVELTQTLKDKWRRAVDWYRARNELKPIIKEVSNAHRNDSRRIRQSAKTRKEAGVS